MSTDTTPGPEPLGSKIRRLRLERQFGQERLAVEANIDQSGLSKFERGSARRPGRAALERIASVLGLPFEELIAGTDYES